MIANVLSIAGSDPSGGAGIQADLKAFSALGAYGMTVITALTAQNTQGVRSFQTVEPGFVAEQIDAIFGDVLWTLSDGGLQASSLSTLDELAWLPD